VTLPASDVGSVMLREIAEQPDALGRLADDSPAFAEVAAEIRRRGVRVLRLVAHGSSDNAASFGVYAFGLLPGWTAVRDSISLTVYYGATIDVVDSCVIALSQSGETPDVVEYVETARRRGAYTVALTNDPTSALARAAETTPELHAGEEHAIAATKTYTNQVAALALLAAHASGLGDEYAEAIRETARSAADALPTLERQVRDLAVPFAFVGRMFVIGRGIEFTTTREISLKLLETCRVAAEPLTTTDMVHGPVAALDTFFPVWAIASEEQSLAAVREAASRARAAGATVIASGTSAHAIPDADAYLPVPTPPFPLLAPLVSVIPGQLFAWALARAKGLDPDRPVGLSKVTLAP
jgi:glucosamine--fructose-6-phosphate aminotransferase (isomerizing)